MYEQKTCEISLLRVDDYSIRRQTPTVHKLPQDMDFAPQTTWSSGTATVHRYLSHERVPLAREHGNTTPSARSAKLRKERDAFNRTTAWPTPPEGKLIVVADAIVRYIEKRWHTWYFILVRSVTGEDAVILPPFVQHGRETGRGWEAAFGALPPDLLARIVALVCDGHRGLVNEAKWRQWLLQRCHFHLLKSIKERRSRWNSGRHHEEAAEIDRLVRSILSHPAEDELTNKLSRLEEIGWATSSRKLRVVLLGFVNHAEEYRTYRVHPEINLPTTSNTAESLNALIKGLAGRARGFRTVAALDAWIRALCKHQRTIKCRRAPTELVC